MAYLLLPLAICLFSACKEVLLPSSDSALVILGISRKVLVHSPSRLGINLGSQSFWDSAQMSRNLIFRNPGFEGEIYRSIIRCASGTADMCNPDTASAWPVDFWKGASFEFIYGNAARRRGTVTSYQVGTATHPGVVFLDQPGKPVKSGDILILTRELGSNGKAGWWPNTCCGGSISTELNDLAAGSPGHQAIRLSSTSGGRAEIASYFDALEAHTFLQLRGLYVLSFRAKGAGGPDMLAVDVGRARQPAVRPYLSRTLTVSREWKQYVLPFQAAETAHDMGTAHVNFAAIQSDILLDDVSLIARITNKGNPTTFRDEVVAALRQLKPGILRYWGGQLGETLDNQLAPEFARRRAGYSVWQSQEDSIRYGLPEFLQLCQAIPADPYYVIPITFSRTEMRGLIEYLGASSTTGYGAVRARLGQVQPWTRIFGKIHLEFGNEAWNPSFKGGTIEDPEAYGRRASDLFDEARKADGWDDQHFDLIIGGQAVNPERNRKILNAAHGFDSFAVAPYQMNEVNSTRTEDELFGPMLAEPQAITASTGYMGQNRSLLPWNSQLIIYEVNASTTGGSIAQRDLDRLIPSLGSALAVIDNMLLNMRDLAVKNQMFWSLPQYMLKRSDGKTVKLFGAVVDMGVTNRKRPVFLGLQLANTAIQGDLVEVQHSGADPMRTQPALNGVPRTKVQLVQSFAFRNGAARSLILLNLSLSDSFKYGSTVRNPRRAQSTCRPSTRHRSKQTMRNGRT